MLEIDRRAQNLQNYMQHTPLQKKFSGKNLFKAVNLVDANFFSGNRYFYDAILFKMTFRVFFPKTLGV